MKVTPGSLANIHHVHTEEVNCKGTITTKAEKHWRKPEQSGESPRSINVLKS